MIYWMNMEQRGSPSFLALQWVLWSSFTGFLLRQIVLPDLGASSFHLNTSALIQLGSLVTECPGLVATDILLVSFGFWSIVLAPAIDYHTIVSSQEVPILCHSHLNPAAKPATYSTVYLPLETWWLLDTFSETIWRRSSVDALSLGIFLVTVFNSTSAGNVLDIRL